MSTGERPALSVDLLGPTLLRVRGVELPTGGPKLRAIVATLGLAQGRLVSVESLLDAVWGEDLPATARNTLQYHVGVLRKSLAADGAAEYLISRDPGYALTAGSDVFAFGDHAALGMRAATEGRHDDAASHFADALNLWRGHALSDLRSFPFAEARAVSLEAQRLTCAEAWADAELASGRAEALLSPLQDLVTENPTRERLWEQLMVALYRTGRQDAALSAYRTARAALDRELGVTPSARFEELHQAVLRHDPKLSPGPALRSLPARPLTQTTLARSELVTAPPTLVGPSGTRVVLGGESVVVGRQSGCDLVLADDQASRQHARIDATPTGYVVVDLESTNGTFVNGVRVEGRARLSDGDRIEVGHSVVRFVARAGVES